MSTANMKERFQLRLPNCICGKFIFKSGKEAPFINGVYLTSIQSEIAELKEEIAAGHQHLSQDPDQLQVDSTKQDPMSLLKARIIAEYEEEQRKNHSKDSDKGNTTGGVAGLATRLNVATSANTASTAAGSNSGAPTAA